MLLQQTAATLSEDKSYVLMMLCHNVNCFVCCLPTEPASLVQFAVCSGIRVDSEGADLGMLVWKGRSS